MDMSIKYKLKKGYQVQDVAGEKVLITKSRDRVSLSKLMILSETAALLINNLSKREMTISEMTQLLTEQYNVSSERAKIDVESLVDKLDELRILQE